MAEILLTRDQILKWAAREFELSAAARMAAMIGVQAIPDSVFAELAQTINDISESLQPGDAARLESKFADRASRRDLIHAVMEYVRRD